MKNQIIISLSILFITFISSFASAKIEGKVVDQFGRGLGNVHVQIVNTGFEAKTDDTGNYLLDYVPGTLKIKFSKPKYTTEYLELDIYTKDKFPAAKVEMWKIPAKGLFLVDTSRKQYIQIQQSFPIKSIKRMHRDPNSLKNLANLGNLASLIFSAEKIGNFSAGKGKILIIDNYPKRISLYKRGKDGVLLSLQEGAYGKIGGLIFSGRVNDEELTEIGEEKLLIRSFNADDGVYLYSEVEKTSDGFGTKFTIPYGRYFPFIIGNPPEISSNSQPESVNASAKGHIASPVKSKPEANHSPSGKSPSFSSQTLRKMALQLVVDSLESGELGVQKTIESNGQIMIGVTPTKSFKYMQWLCKEFTIVSYASGKPVTMKNNGTACRAEGKWYPYVMFTNPQKQGLPYDQFEAELIGTQW